MLFSFFFIMHNFYHDFSAFFAKKADIFPSNQAKIGSSGNFFALFP